MSKVSKWFLTVCLVAVLVTGSAFAAPGGNGNGNGNGGNPPGHDSSWTPPGHRGDGGQGGQGGDGGDAFAISVAKGGQGGDGGNASVKVGDTTVNTGDTTATGGDASATGGTASVENVNNAGATVNTKTTVFVPPSPPSIPGNEYVDLPTEEMTYSNVNMRDVDNKTWPNAGALKDYAKVPNFLIFPDWNKFGITVSPLPVAEDIKLAKVEWFKTFNIARHKCEFDSDELVIEGKKYVRVADLSGDVQVEGINQNRTIAAAAYLAKKTGACILVYETFTNTGSIGESGTIGGGTNVIGTGPMSANVVVGSASKSISKKTGLPGIIGTAYALVKE